MTRETRNIAIATIGKVGVGKTSIVHLLDEGAKSRGTTYVVSVGGEPFDRFLFIITDSTREDVNGIKYSLRHLRELFPDTRFAIIANKQDLADRLQAFRIEKMTNLPTLEISAIDTSHRSRLVNFISYLIGSDSGL